jgi:AbrB family looped-hinge helix DNA binding protein
VLNVSPSMGPDLNRVPNDASNPKETATYCLRKTSKPPEVTSLARVARPGARLYYSSAKVKAMSIVSSKNQVTIPVEAMRAAGLRAGDEIDVRPVREGEIVIATRGSRIRRHAGIAKGIYKDNELGKLRDEWER